MTQNSGIPASTPGLVGRGGLAVALLLAAACTQAGTFDSGSDGSDGALVLTDPGTILFDPNAFDSPLDPDGDGVYHFTTTEIGADTVVRMKTVPMGVRPVVWLASGDVRVGGVLDLDGENGHRFNEPAVPAIGGAGGYAGGQGTSPGIAATPGLGPGGGNATCYRGNGCGGSHVENGYRSTGKTYGNAYIIPMIGGSGGGGGGQGGGGAGAA